MCAAKLTSSWKCRQTNRLFVCMLHDMFLFCFYYIVICFSFRVHFFKNQPRISKHFATDTMKRLALAIERYIHEFIF